jgi:rhodanese-related sulfurtransferase
MRNSLTDIDPPELLDRLRRQDETVILDVRTRWEYRRGHLPGARRTPLWKTLLASTAESLRDAPEIVAYCELGPRAWLARKLLARRGVDVRLLRGHMSNWRRRRLPFTG